MIELGGGGKAASRGLSQCTQETDKHIRYGCGFTLRTRRNGLAALISEGNAYALLTILLATICTCVQRLLQLAMMTEHVLLITCCSCA